jgi:hypothetical protein
MVQKEIESGTRRALPFRDNAEISKGELFILDGQKIYVAEKGEVFINPYDRADARLRVIYDNGTQSDILLRSLQRALNKDKTSRRISEPSLGPLFSQEEDENDLKSGFIYVLRSLSDNPFVAVHRTVIHKIGVTGGDVAKRITGAEKDPTYLLAGVEIVQTYRLSNVNRKKLETLLHQFLANARLDLELKDRFGHAVEPREWFLVPLPIISETIEKLMNGSLGDYRYDSDLAQIVSQ